jgi:Putative phage serine protease XkdF
MQVILPSVLLPGALLPPTGTSGLPASLAEVVPAEMRYWEARSFGEARKRHDVLARSGFFTPDNVRMVQGKLCKVVTYLYRPPAAAPEPEATEIGDGSDMDVGDEEVAKSADFVFDRALPIRKACEEKQSFVAIVLEPRTAANPDLQGEYYNAEEIWKASKKFMQYVTKGIAGSRTNGLGLMHDGMANEKVQLIGNLVMPYDGKVTDPMGVEQVVPGGTWVQEWHVPHSDTWSDVKKGTLRGLSIEGVALKIKRKKKAA